MDTKDIAVITAKAFIKGKEALDHSGDPCTGEVETTTDCPSDALGEAVAIALQRVWLTGCDPVLDKVTVVVSFGGRD